MRLCDRIPVSKEEYQKMCEEMGALRRNAVLKVDEYNSLLEIERRNVSNLNTELDELRELFKASEVRADDWRLKYYCLEGVILKVLQD